MRSQENACHSACNVQGAVEEPLIPSLDPCEVRRLVWEGVTLLDARSARDHARSPRRATVHLCHLAPRQQLQALGGDPTLPLVCCSNGEHRARRLAQRLKRLGYRHVYVLRGGLEALTPQLLG